MGVDFFGGTEQAFAVRNLTGIRLLQSGQAPTELNLPLPDCEERILSRIGNPVSKRKSPVAFVAVTRKCQSAPPGETFRQVTRAEGKPEMNTETMQS